MTSLKRQKDFEALFRRGRWITPKASNVRIKSARGDHFQTAISIPRKAGKAVLRNRARRQVREILRHLETALNIRGQFVLILNKEFVENEFARKHKELEGIFAHFMAC